jgi:hypothetical protein
MTPGETAFFTLVIAAFVTFFTATIYAASTSRKR